MISNNLSIKNNILYFGGRSTVELAEKYEHVYAAIGVHPTDVKEDIEEV